MLDFTHILNVSVYVDVSGSQCNDLNMLLGASGVGNSITTRSWSIRITQYSCNYPNLAPEGCTEYFFGSDTGTITNYNNGGGTHLNDQFQKSCIRREKGNCRICYTTVTGYSDFGISGKFAHSQGTCNNCQSCISSPFHSCTKRGSNLKNFSHTKSIYFQSTHAGGNSKLRILKKSTDGPLR